MHHFDKISTKFDEVPAGMLRIQASVGEHSSAIVWNTDRPPRSHFRTRFVSPRFFRGLHRLNVARCASWFGSALNLSHHGAFPSKKTSQLRRRLIMRWFSLPKAQVVKALHLWIFVWLQPEVISLILGKKYGYWPWSWRAALFWIDSWSHTRRVWGKGSHPS